MLRDQMVKKSIRPGKTLNILLNDFLLTFATLSYNRPRSNCSNKQWFLANDLARELSYHCHANQPGWTRKGKLLNK